MLGKLRLSLRMKMFGGFGIALLIVAGVGAFSYRTTGENQTNAFWIDHTHNVIGEAEGALAELVNMETGYRSFLVTGQDEFLDPYNGGREAYKQNLTTLQTLTSDNPAQVARWQDLEQRAAAWQAEITEPGIALRNEVTAGAMTSADVIAFETSGEGKRHFDGMRAIFADAIGEEQRLLEIRGADGEASAGMLKQVVLWGTVFAIAAGAVIAFFLSRTITSGIDKMRRAAVGISGGDLEQDVEVSSQDEIGDMSNAFGEMITYLDEMATTADSIADGDLTVSVQPRSDKDRLGNSLRTMIQNLREVIGGASEAAANLIIAKDQLASASKQAAEATNETAKTTSQIAKGTAQQATAVQEVSAGVDRLNAAADQLDAKARSDVAEAAIQMAEGARAASEGANQAAETAQSGATMVQKTVEGIGRIQAAVDGAAREVTGLGAQSEEIGKIVAVIEDIAAQTNLLALNAAIEAARAGEQGRGFAVVADEVRQLAERVAGATKEIATLIEGVQNGVEASVKAMEEGTTEMAAGSEAAAEARESLTAILTAVESATSQIQDIATRSDALKSASEEMVELVEEVKSVASSASDSVSQIASVAEQNSAATEQVSAASEQMSAQVEEVSAAAVSLGELADGLRDQVSAFRLDKSQDAAATPKSGDAPQAEPTPA